MLRKKLAQTFEKLARPAELAVYRKKFGPKKNKTLSNDKEKVGPDLFKVGLGPTSWPYIKKKLARPLGPRR